MTNKHGARIAATLIGAVLIAGCGGRGGDGAASSAGRNLPQVTSTQAEQAMSDAMLVSALSLFLAFGAEEGDTSVSDDDGGLSLSWDEDADFTSGIGTYTITMKDYTVPPDDPFGVEYNGYTLNGTVVMGSTDGTNTTMTMNLATSHADAEAHPVKLIELELNGFQSDPDAMPTGFIRINGHDMEFEDLVGAFQGG